MSGGEGGVCCRGETAVTVGVSPDREGGREEGREGRTEGRREGGREGGWCFGGGEFPA
jgi:hypothetical protein